MKGAVILDEKPDTVRLTLGSEFPGFKEEQFKCTFDRNANGLKHKEVGARNAWHDMLLRH